jgi:DNA transposition AAA+ family ATPase
MTNEDTHHSTGSETPISAREALIGRERIRGAARIIAEGTEAAAVTGEQIQAVANDVELFCRTHKISRKQVGRAVGYAAGVVSDFLTGKYAGNRAQVAIDLEAWLVEEEQRRERPQTTQFVWTNVALEIKSVANYCLDYRKIGLVYGPDTSGIGKTTALQAIHQDMGPRRSSLVTIDKVDANPTGLLKKLCHGLRVQDSGSTAQRFRRVVESLTGRSHLLLIDQIHNLRGATDDRPFYILADLYDATQTAQLWCGTADLVAYLNRQQKRNVDESLAQIRRRIFPCVDLMEALRGPDGGGERLVTIEQVREMFARNKLKLAGAAARFLCQICNAPDSGGVGLCVQVVEYATMMAEIRGVAAIDVALLKEALRRGFTPHRADELLNKMADRQTPPIAAAMVG